MKFWQRLSKQLKDLNAKVELRNNNLLTHFIKSSTKEAHLKEYIDDLTNKLFEGDLKYATQFDKKVCEIHSEIIHSIENIQDKVKKDGVTIVPLELFLAHGFAKIEIGLAKGKKIYDKREAITKKTQERDIARLVKR